MVFAFIDTNVLLQFKFFDEVDWAGEFGVGQVTLVFTPVVYSELDNFKWAGTRRQKDRARAVSKRLDSLALSTSPVKVRQAVDAIGLDEEPDDALFAKHRLHPQSKDDRLLASYFGFVEHHGGARVLVLSADSGLGMKARSRRIELVVPAEALELPDEPDEVVRELEKARRELAELKNASPDLRLTFGEGQTHGRFEVQFVTPFDYLTRDALSRAWRQRYPHRAATAVLFGIGGNKMSLAGFSGLPGFMSEKEAADYNAGVDRVFFQYSAFLAAWPAMVNASRRILSLKPVLENLGTAPALDINVQLSTDASGRWLEELPEVPKAPRMPKARSRFDIPVLPTTDFERIAGYRAVSSGGANEDGPHISDDVAQVRYSAKRVLHNLPCALPAVHFQFDSDDSVRSFAINVRLVAGNIREPRTDVLHIEVVRSALSIPPRPSEPGEDAEE